MLGIAVTAVLVFVRSESSAESLARARAERQRQVELCLREQQGPDAPARIQGLTPEEFCEQFGAPPESAFDRRFHLTTLRDVLEGTSVPLIILGLALGASFIGAEWGAGTVAMLLTWEPRRVLVVASKIAAAALFVFAAAIALQALLGLALVPAAVWRGTTEGAGTAWLWSVTGVVMRGAVIAGLAAVIGFAIASIARNTTAALVIGFVYFAVAEGLIRGLRPRWQPWLIGDNAASFVTGRWQGIFPGVEGHSTIESGLIVAAYAGVLAVVAGALFARRDVT